MKKLLLIAALATLSSPAFAGIEYSSSTRTVNVELKDIGNKYYSITLNVHTRNTLKAIYHAEGTNLTKVFDQSTWKDMPEQLQLEHSGFWYKLSGLDVGEVKFHERTCWEGTSAAPVGQFCSAPNVGWSIKPNGVAFNFAPNIGMPDPSMYYQVVAKENYTYQMYSVEIGTGKFIGLAAEFSADLVKEELNFAGTILSAKACN